MDASVLYTLGITLIFIGILVTAVAFLLLLLASVRGEGKIRGGGALIIGPFPIIFGTDKESIKAILLLSLLLTILLVLLIVMLHFMF